ncbi:N2,N2-dimethylguanosine tRNA methyltransferase [Sulfolobales archaeon HS-7]|nr:N2,N2-dimethylguanosine tRNA methyltransferase [Sulfolobales archaeon HS-7]
MNLIEITEGKAKLLVPDPKAYEKDGKFDPAWLPVFYNPKMVFNRDVSVIITSLLKVKECAEPLAASGVRGIRYQLEAGVESLFLNDINPLAVSLMNQNSRKNHINAVITNGDASSVLYSITAQLVDLDPFGSPVPFLIPSLNAIRNNGYLAVTATDLSPLMGSAPNACKRKYIGENQKLSFNKEAGVRILIYKIIQEAASLDLAARPIFAFFRDHYFRVILNIKRGAKLADSLLDNVGFYIECSVCGFAVVEKNRIGSCPRCNGKTIIAGPLWLGSLWENSIIEQFYANLGSFQYLYTFNRVKKFMQMILQEMPYQTTHYWNLTSLASKRKVNLPKMEKFIECLGKASRTHFDELGFKTSKSFDEILECIKTS